MAGAPERNKELIKLNQAYLKQCEAKMADYPDRIRFMGQWWVKETKQDTPG